LFELSCTPVDRDTTFTEVSARVARELGISVREVRLIVREFLHQAGDHLARNHTLQLEGLGKLSLSIVQAKSSSALVSGPRKKGGGYGRRRRIVRNRLVLVSFTKSARLKKLAQMYVEENMDKLGVDEKTDSEQLEKQSAQGCPECGSKVERHGTVLQCPSCGTAPFEPRNKGPRR